MAPYATGRRRGPSSVRALGLVGLLFGHLAATASHAAGTLTPVGAAHQPIRIAADHQVGEALTNGFAHQTGSAS
jgi:hypothetical protein